MKVAWSGRIGSREGDVMGLCDGACDVCPCIVHIEENCEKTLCKKCSDICARLWGSKGKGRKSRSSICLYATEWTVKSGHVLVYSCMQTQQQVHLLLQLLHLPSLTTEYIVLMEDD